MIERKPGKGDLLLKQKLGGGGGGGAKKHPAGVSKKTKQPKPSMAKQAAMEKERVRVVEAYRALKAERYAS